MFWLFFGCFGYVMAMCYGHKAQVWPVWPCFGSNYSNQVSSPLLHDAFCSPSEKRTFNDVQRHETLKTLRLSFFSGPKMANWTTGSVYCSSKVQGIGLAEIFHVEKQRAAPAANLVLKVWEYESNYMPNHANTCLNSWTSWNFYGQISSLCIGSLQLQTAGWLFVWMCMVSLSVFQIWSL